MGVEAKKGHLHTSNEGGTNVKATVLLLVVARRG